MRWHAKRYHTMAHIAPIPETTGHVIDHDDGSTTLLWCDSDTPRAYPLVPFATQKARGLRDLVAAHRDYPVPAFATHHAARIASGLTMNTLQFPLFARPCPMRPRHGFVESRRVYCVDELRALARETIAVEPQAEIVLMTEVRATHNMVWADQVITIGRGHDGATAGRDAVTLPAAGPAPIRGIEPPPPGETGYFEFVRAQDGTPYCVQYRYGPHIGSNYAADAYIPVDMVVREIMAPSDDLLEWERWCKNNTNAARRGIVVYHPGGALHSHAAIHCVLHNIPYTTKPVHVGTALKATTGGPAAWSPMPALFGAGYMRGVLATRQQDHHIDQILYAQTNCIALLGGPETWRAMLGYACGLAVRYGGVACIGEARHDADTPWKGSRDDVYAEAFERDVYHLIEDVHVARESFARKHWAKGYGGPRWRKCADAVLALHRAANACQERRAALALNRVVNAMHNNAKMLTKFSSLHGFDMWANAPTRATILCVEELYGWERSMRGLWQNTR